MPKSYRVGWCQSLCVGPWDFSVNPRPHGFGFGTIGFRARAWQFQDSKNLRPTYLYPCSCTFGLEIDDEYEISYDDYGETVNYYEKGSLLSDNCHWSKNAWSCFLLIYLSCCKKSHFTFLHLWHAQMLRIPSMESWVWPDLLGQVMIWMMMMWMMLRMLRIYFDSWTSCLRDWTLFHPAWSQRLDW